LLAEGLNILAGAPKLGKSILALNLALTVAGGGKALGNIQSQPGHVLYLSLEDRLRRVQSRAAKMLTKIQGTGAGDRLSVLNRWPRMDHGGLALLSEWVKRVGRPALIIIDVLGKFKPPSRDRGNQYEQDCQALYPVKEFADENKCTALVIHHTRKTRGKDDTEDFVETVNGTLGTTGACDGILVLQRSRNSKEARISLTSRDDAEQKLALEFDDESLTWKSMGSAEEYLTGKLQTRVMGYLKSLAGSFTFVSDIADHLGEPPDKLRPVLHRLFERGLLRHKGQTWGYPGPNAEGTSDTNEEAF
jgi:RecA-family ATPase